LLFVIAATACGTAPTAVAPPNPVPAATAAPVATAPPTAVLPTDAPTIAATHAPTTAAATHAPTTAAVVGEIQHAPAGVFVSANTPERAGQYIVGWLGNCNDCHTPGWGVRPNEGLVPIENWDMGGEKNVSAAGVTYSANLRLVPGKMSLEEFIAGFKTRENPRMPWPYFRDINDKDLTAVYNFLKSLGPKGEATPPFATATPKATIDPAAPTADPAAPTATMVHGTPTAAPPTATVRPDLLPPSQRPLAPPEAFVSASSPELAGEYIIWVGRCNSCHTADRATGVVNWTPTTPKDDWLMGGRKSSGNYGTVYSANLRLTPQNYTEDEFVKMMKTRATNPPMPWFALHQFNEKDLRSVYAFLKSLGPKGDPVPPFVPPAPTATP
jgi:mono/diheme cytochrome c family protein